MTTGAANGRVARDNLNINKEQQKCNGSDKKNMNGKISNHSNGFAKDKLSNGLNKHIPEESGYIPWIDWSQYDTSRGSFEECSLLTAMLTHLGLYLLMFLGFLNQLLFKPKVASERNREGYAPLYNPFDQFFSRYLYRRVRHCFNRPISSAPSVEILLKERQTDDYNWSFRFTGEELRCVNLGSYNYLGFAGESSESVEAARRYGLALCSSRAELGSTELHSELERTTAEFLGVEAAIVFGMGFATNTLALPGLLGPDCLALSDERNHASLIMGMKLARVTVRVFRHNDVKHLERLARQAVAEGKWKKIIVVAEGVYSMEGSVIPLPAVLAIKRQYNLYLYLDEAHSIGAMGPRGRGITDYYGVDPKEVDILMGTFTKSFGAAGGYIAGSRRLVEWVRAHGHAHTYAHAMSPPIAQQVLSSMRSIGWGDGRLRVDNLLRNTRYFRAGLAKIGVVTYGHADSPVVPMLVYTFSKMAITVEKLTELGIATVGVGFPATPLSEGRIRFCLSSNHTKEHLDSCLDAVESVADSIGLRYSRRKRPQSPDSHNKTSWCPIGAR